MKKYDNETDYLIEKLLSNISEEDQEDVGIKVKLAIKLSNAIKRKYGTKKKFAESFKKPKRPSEISKWLKGTHNFTLDTLLDIQRKLEIRIVDTEDNLRSSMSSSHLKVIWMEGIVKPNPKNLVKPGAIEGDEFQPQFSQYQY